MIRLQKGRRKQSAKGKRAISGSKKRQNNSVDKYISNDPRHSNIAAARSGVTQRATTNYIERCI